MNIWDYLLTIGKKEEEEKDEKTDKSGGGGSAGAIEPEENPLDILNGSIEKNYKDYLKLQKNLTEFDTTLSEIPDMMKPTIIANYNKQVTQFNSLIGTLQTDIAKRDEIYSVQKKQEFVNKKQLGIYQPQPDVKSQPQESGLKDIWDAFRLGSSGMIQKTKQYFNSVLPNAIFAPIKKNEMGKINLTDEQVEKVNINNEKKREVYKEKYQQAETNYNLWLQKNPELKPRPEWEKGVIETVKKNPKVLLNPAYWGYVAAQSAAFTLGVMGTTLATTAITGNPLIGMASGVLIATPMQSQELYEDLVANGATEEQAAQLSVPIGGLIATVEVMGDLPILASVSAPFKKMLFGNINKTVAKATTGLLAKGIKTFATIEASETLEEVVQGAIQDATVKTVNENRSMLENIPETIVQTLIATAPLAIVGAGSEVQITEQLKKKVTDINYLNALRVQLEDLGFVPKTEMEVFAYKSEEEIKKETTPKAKPKALTKEQAEKYGISQEEAEKYTKTVLPKADVTQETVSEETINKLEELVGKETTPREVLKKVEEKIAPKEELKVTKDVAPAKQVEEPPVPPKKITVPEMVGEPAGNPIVKLNELINKAKPQRVRLETEYTKERAKRIAEVEKALDEIGGEKGYVIALSKLKGELVPRNKIVFEPIKEKLSQPELDDIYNKTFKHPYLDEWEKISTANALTELLSGELPTPKGLVLLEEVYGSDLIKNVLLKRPLGFKITDFLIDLGNLPRALLATADMSAFLRQGIIPVVSHPVIAIKAMEKTFKFAFSPKAFEQYFKDLTKDPLYPLMRKSDLAITDPSRVSVSGREEAFISRSLQKIPIIGDIIKFAERAYVGFLNKLRVDVFKTFADEFLSKGFSPVKDANLFKATAEVVNTFTGRGSMGTLNRITPSLNIIFFSPRLITARFNALNPIWYAKMPKEIRIKALCDFAKFVSAGITLLALISASGLGDVEPDPRSSDFGKIRIGNTRWDIWGGFQQWCRVFAQLITGERKNTATGEIISLSKDEYPFTTRKEVLLRFIEGKLAPVPALINELMAGAKTFTGEDMTFETVAREKFIPMYIQDIAEAYADGGFERAAGAGVTAFFGVGVQTWGEKEAKPVQSEKPEILKKTIGAKKPAILKNKVSKPKVLTK